MRLFNLVPVSFAILTFAITLTFVVGEGERPKVPLVTPSTKLKPTSADVQVQLTEVVFGKHGYLPCEGHVVLMKRRNDARAQPLQVKIEEREGGFHLPGLEPKTEYLIQVACKALGPDGLFHPGDFTQPIVIRTSDFEQEEEKHEEPKGSGNTSSMSLFLITLCGLFSFTITHD